MYPLIKRLFDILISALALIILSPLLLVLCVLIRLESPGAPIFVHQRIGLHGNTFAFLKLRSMVKDAAARGPYWTSDNDPRITRTGRFLRGSSLDELPQLWNVLKGDMSLVGPRPETPAQKELYTPADWELRHRVKPGITGLAQVMGRSNLTPEVRLKYDLEYASHPSLALDIKIFFKTFGLVLKRVGVN